MKKVRTPGRARTSIIVSLALLASILIGFVCAFFYGFNIREIRDDVDRVNLQWTRQVSFSLDERLNAHRKLAYQLASDAELFAKLASAGTGDVYEGLVRLRQYLDYYDSSKHGIHLLSRANDSVFGSAGRETRDVFFQTRLLLDEASRNAILSRVEDWDNAKTIDVLAATTAQGERILVALYPISLYRTLPTAILLVPLDNAEIAGLFASLLANLESGADAFLLGGAGEILWSSGRAERLLSGRASDELSLASGVLRVSVEGEECSLLYTASEKTGLKCGVIAPVEAYEIRVIRQKTLIWQMLIFLFMLCVAAIVALTFYNYRPVKRIMRQFGSDERDEYAAISRHLLESRSREERYEQTLALQRPYVLEKLLSYALFSNEPRELIRRTLDSMGMRFDHECFFALRVRTENAKASAALRQQLIDRIHAMSDADCTMYALERLDSITVVGNLDDAERYGRVCGRLSNLMETTLGDKCRLTAGAMLKDPAELADSLTYVEAGGEPAAPRAAQTQTPPALRAEILEYVRRNFMDTELSLASIGEHFGISPYYISHIFRDQNNMSLKDCVAALRIGRAKELLTDGDTGIGEICESVGYASVSSFTRKFKQSTGVTPTEYRRAERKASEEI